MTIDITIKRIRPHYNDMHKRKSIVIMLGIVIALLVSSLLLNPGINDAAKIINIDDQKTYQTPPPLLKVSGISKKTEVILKLRRESRSKEYQLEYISDDDGVFNYTLPVVGAGSYDIVINGKKRVTFNVQYYKSDIVNYDVCVDEKLELGDSNNCFKQYFLSNLNSPSDVERALKEIIKVATKDDSPNNNFRCHLMAHWVGESAIFAYPKVEDALKLNFTSCDKGYIHGVISGSIMNLNLNYIKNNIDTICEYSGNSAEINSCIHGLGHDFYKKFGESGKSFELCATFKEINSKNECASGVSMDVGFWYLANSPDEVKINPNLANDICQSLNNSIRNGCYRFIFLIYNEKGGYTGLKELLRDVCEKVSGNDNISCWTGAAIEYTTSFPEATSKNLWDFCRQGKEQALKLCIGSAISYRLQQANIPTAKDFCSYAKNLPERRELCEYWLLYEKESSTSFGNVYKPVR